MCEADKVLYSRGSGHGSVDMNVFMVCIWWGGLAQAHSHERLSSKFRLPVLIAVAVSHKLYRM